MPKSAPLFSILGIRVYVPANSMVGLALVAWFAIPTVQEVIPTAGEMVILGVALLHAVALYLSILVHELGHAFSAQRRKYEVDGVSLTIIGGHTTVHTNYRRARDQAIIALAGPLATLLVGLAAWASTAVTSGVAHSITSWLAWSSFIIGMVNLLPGIPLDGGAILDAIVWRLSRNRTRGRQVAALSGLGVAALWACSPWIVGAYFGRAVQTSDVIISGVVGLWMASTAWRAFIWAARPEALSVEQINGDTSAPSDTSQVAIEATALADNVAPAVPSPEIRAFVRRAIAVDIRESLEVALRIAAEAGAGAIVVTSGNRIVGIVRDAAVAQYPVANRASATVASVARRIENEDRVLIGASVADISSQLSNIAAQEWLVVDDDDAIVGVLFRSDLRGSANV